MSELYAPAAVLGGGFSLINLALPSAQGAKYL